MVRMKNKGFTLIELLVTVAIIGILAAISVPLYVGQQKKAAMSEAQTNLQNIRLLEEQFFADRGRYCPDADNDATTAETAFFDETRDVTPVPAASINVAACLNGRFRPGKATDLKYDYEITVPDPNAPAGTTSSFIAYARPKLGTIVGRKNAADRSGDFWINDRNQSNIQ